MDITQLSVGAYQPIPFPAPVWVLQTLLVAGFFMHAIPMNVALTGGVTSAVLLLMGGKDETAYTTRTGRQIAAALPIFTTFAITNGIVPLLFLQVLYGPLVYSSSIVMALPWFSILFLITIAYYGIYIYNYGKGRMSLSKAPWVLIASSMLFMVVAFIFSNNMTLMLTPEKFVPMYQNSPAGANLNLTEPSLIPRYLHFVTAAFSVTGLFIGCLGIYQKTRNADFSKWLVRLGASMFTAITLIGTIFGIWFMLSTPEGFQAAMMGGDKMTTHLFRSSLGFEVLSLIFMGVAIAKGSTKAFWGGLITAMVVIAEMVVLRHLLRVHMTDDVMGPLMASQPVVIQWPILIMFLVLFVGMFFFIGWLGKLVFKAYNKD